MKYHIITFGCQMNKSDSERIAALLEKIDYKKASNISEADLIVVNMCSVRQSPVDRVYGLKPKLKDKKTILTGCFLKKDKRKFSEIFDYLLDIKNLANWPKILNKSVLKEKDYFKIKPKCSDNITGLIPIMTGCNNFCTYCVVPYTRGREIFRPADEIISEVKNLLKQGAKEIWLLGQNVNSYNSFPKLLKIINKIPGKFWIRFTSSHPKDFSDELIKAMKESKKVTEYLNLPAQSGDNKILKKMNRPYKIEDYKKIVKKVKKEIPEITLSTDIIVGFPGETRKQFENTKKLLKGIKYDMAYISRYSPRPETAAAKLKDNVSLKEKKRRKKVLLEILKQTALENNKNYIGKEIEVLISYKNPKGLWLGKTRNYKTVQIESNPHTKRGQGTEGAKNGEASPHYGVGANKNLLGKFVKVKITNALAWGLKGKI